MHRLNIFQDMRTQRQAVFNGIGLHQVKQHLLQKMVLGRGFFTGDLIGAVFAIGEVFRHRATRTAVGEGKYRRAGRAGVGKAIGVNRHKKIGAVLVGNFHAVVQRDKGIARTRQARVNTVIAQNAAYVFGNRQYDMLLF